MHTTPYTIDEAQDYSHRPNFSPRKNNFAALYTLIVSTCLITFWVWADSTTREMRYAYTYRCVELGELYRLFTAGFLHRNKDHLTNNMLSLLIWGLLLCHRTKMSNIKFCLFYISAIICSSYFAHRYYMHHLSLFDVQSLGASGGVFAVKCACLLLGYKPRKIKNLKAIRILNLILFCHFFFDTYNKLDISLSDGIAHEAHFGGALCGIAFALFYYPKLIFSGILADKPPTSNYQPSELHTI